MLGYPTIEWMKIMLIDEEPLTGDESLHMMQQKEHIDMLLFGERNPLVFGSQVVSNMFAATDVCITVEKKEKKEEEEE